MIVSMMLGAVFAFLAILVTFVIRSQIQAALLNRSLR
jgi:hypothetical protein